MLQRLWWNHAAPLDMEILSSLKGQRNKRIDKSWPEVRTMDWISHLHGRVEILCLYRRSKFFLKIQTLNKECWLPNTNSAVTQHLFAFAKVFILTRMCLKSIQGFFQNHLNIRNPFYNSAPTDSWDVSPPTSKAVDHPSIYCFKLIVSAGYSF